MLKILFSFHLTSRILLPFLGSGCSTRQREYRNLRNTNEYAKRVQWIYCRESWIHFSTFWNKGYSKRNNQWGWIPIYSSIQKTITLFTAEVSAAVFASEENSPLEYVIKSFYPNKNLYPEQIQKLHSVVWKGLYKR